MAKKKHLSKASGTPAFRFMKLSTAAWFPYWTERELHVTTTQIRASVVRPAQCFLMTLAFQGAPLSFAEPMCCATGTPRHRSKAR